MSKFQIESESISQREDLTFTVEEYQQYFVPVATDEDGDSWQYVEVFGDSQEAEDEAYRQGVRLEAGRSLRPESWVRVR